MECEGLPVGPELTVCQAARAASEAAGAAKALAEGDSWSEIVVAILGAISALALPVLAGVVLILLWPLLRDLFETRKFSLKIGGFELSAQEATDQIRKQIEELQAQIVELKAAQPSSVPQQAGDIFRPASPDSAASLPFEALPAPPGAGLPSRPSRPVPQAILWVDDNPENNAFLVADFMDAGIKVDLARSTAEGVRMLAAGRPDYAVIISDLGRQEAGRYVPDAGAELAAQVRALGSDLPILIYSTSRAVRARDKLIAAGVTEVTRNTADLRALVLSALSGRGA